jgi:hypothetical protein
MYGIWYVIVIIDLNHYLHVAVMVWLWPTRTALTYKKWRRMGNIERKLDDGTRLRVPYSRTKTHLVLLTCSPAVAKANQTISELRLVDELAST